MAAVMTFNERTNTLEFTCSECGATMRCTFWEGFKPDEHPDFVFCCLGCGRRYKITSWTPTWIVRDLDAGVSENVEKYSGYENA